MASKKLSIPQTSLKSPYQIEKVYERCLQNENTKEFNLLAIFCQTLRNQDRHEKHRLSVNVEQSTSYEMNNYIEKSHTELLNRIVTLWFASKLERQQAFDLLERNQILLKISPEFLAHLAYRISKPAMDISVESCRTATLYEAFELSRLALMSSENCAFCHFSYGHIIGVILEKNELSLKEKMHEATVFKYHMEKTIEIDRNFYEAYAYLGRFEYTASNLNSIERKAISLLGFSIEGSLDKALEYLHTARKGTCYMMHDVYLLIGKIYRKKKKYDEAKSYLAMCVTLPTQLKKQNDIINEAKHLLKDKNLVHASLIHITA